MLHGTKQKESPQTEIPVRDGSGAWLALIGIQGGVGEGGMNKCVQVCTSSMLL